MNSFSQMFMTLFLMVLLVISITTGHAEIDVQTGLECVDRDDKCPLMATMGECKTNRSYTNEHCRKSCDRCRVMRVNSSEEMQRIMQQKKEELMKQRRERKEAQRILEKGFEL